MTDRDAALPVTLDLARALAWIANTSGGWLDRKEAVEFVQGLAGLGQEAMLFVTGERLKELDPEDVREEQVYVFGREQTMIVRGSEATRHWEDAWIDLQNAGRTSSLCIYGRPAGRPSARMELVPAMEFSRLIRTQGDDSGSRLALRTSLDVFWDKVEMLTADVLRLWPIDNVSKMHGAPATGIADAPPRPRRGVRGSSKLGEVVEVLSSLYPNDEPASIDRAHMLDRVVTTMGRSISLRTLDRAIAELWPK